MRRTIRKIKIWPAWSPLWQFLPAYFISVLAISYSWFAAAAWTGSHQHDPQPLLWHIIWAVAMTGIVALFRPTWRQRFGVPGARPVERQEIGNHGHPRAEL